MRKIKSEEKCSIPACWQPVKASGMCAACLSWWYRVQVLSAGEMSLYLKRLDRFASRAQRVGGMRRRRAA